MTLASIVEWEARYDEEKPAIAGVYLNRLLARKNLAHDVDVLSCSRHRPSVRNAVPSLNHLWAGSAETYNESTI